MYYRPVVDVADVAGQPDITAGHGHDVPGEVRVDGGPLSGHRRTLLAIPWLMQALQASCNSGHY